MRTKAVFTFLAMLMIHQFAMAQIQIGSGTENRYLPVSPNDLYSYSQFIYLQNEIAQPVLISAIQFYFAGNSLNNSNEWVIYMGHTSKTGFNNKTDWIPLSQLTQVWSGTFDDPGEAGWISFIIDDFQYNNVENLIIAVDENASGSNSSYFFSSATTSGSSRSIYVRSNGSNPNPQSPPWASAIQSYVPNIKLFPSGNLQNSTTIQINEGLAPDRSNQPIIGIVLEVDEQAKAFPTVSSFTVNANGSTLPLANHIANPKIFYTANESSFHDQHLFGEGPSAIQNADFDIEGSQTLFYGTNYFWLTFDILPEAIHGNQVDASCMAIMVDGQQYQPENPSPDGSRIITAALSGQRTIGPGMDYPNFSSAINELAILGINGPLELLVSSGNYHEQISIPAIPGVGPEQELVFRSQSGNPEDVNIHFAPTSGEQNFVLQFDNTAFVTFKEMQLTNTADDTYGCVVRYSGNNHDITLEGNALHGISLNEAVSYNLLNSYTVVYGPNTIGYQRAALSIIDNTIRNGTVGVGFFGREDGPHDTDVIIAGNDIKDFLYDGISLEYHVAPYINKNILHGAEQAITGQKGIFLNEVTGYFEVSQNQILLRSIENNSGIACWFCFGESDQKGQLVNNFVSIDDGYDASAIGLMDCGRVFIAHNTLQVFEGAAKPKGNPKSTGMGAISIASYYMPTPLYGDNTISRNIIQNESAAVPLIKVDQNSADNGYVSSNYNNFYNAGSSSFGEWGQASIGSFEVWQSVSQQDMESFERDAQLPGPTEPTPGNTELTASVPRASEVLEDLFDKPRESETTPGAVEIGGEPEPTALFHVGGSVGSRFYCVNQLMELDPESEFAAVATFQAEVDDWLLSGFSLNSSGSGDETADIAKVRVHLSPPQDLTYTADNGLLHVAINPPVLIQEGQIFSVLIHYEFDIDPDTYANDTLKSFAWTIPASSVLAEAVNYTLSELAGEAQMHPITAGRVYSYPAFTYFPTIDKAVDELPENSVLYLCPVRHEANVTLDKKITIRGEDGMKNQTIVEPADPKTPIFYLINGSGGSTFEHFTIQQ